jgi:hypothetical protein
MKNFPFLRQKKDKDKDKKKASSLTKGRQPAAPTPPPQPAVAAKKEQATPSPVKMVRPSTNLMPSAYRCRTMTAAFSIAMHCLRPMLSSNIPFSPNLSCTA